MISNLGLGLFGGALLLLSYFGNIFVYVGIATEEDRPAARRWYYAVNGVWSLMNIGIIALLVWKCFV